MSALRELFELIAEHPIVTLFLTWCIWSFSTGVANLIKYKQVEKEEEDGTEL